MGKPLLAILFLTMISGCSDDSELAETLAWMDNTYNPHKDVGAYGHGHTGWYVPKGSSPYDEYLVNGSTETFTHDGCRMTLNIQDDPAAFTHREILSSRSYTFNLRDINPASIKTSTFTHTGGFNCDLAKESKLIPQDCDHAEVVFATHNEAPLIDEYTDTIFLKLQGSDHENKSSAKTRKAFFEVDDIEYAGRLAKAFRYAVELCGGKPEPFSSKN